MSFQHIDSSEPKPELQSASEPVLRSQAKTQGRSFHQPLQQIPLPQADRQAEPLPLNTQKVTDSKLNDQEYLFVKAQTYPQ